VLPAAPGRGEAVAGISATEVEAELGPFLARPLAAAE
jgi:hypothetical protein